MTRQDYIALCERKIQEAREELASFPSSNWEDSYGGGNDEDFSEEKDVLHRQINWHQNKLRELRG